MASFRTHLTVAAVLSGSAAGLAVEAGLIDYIDAFMLFALGAVAGILPDVDSDHSIATRLVFNLLSGAAALMLLFVFVNHLPLAQLLSLAVGGALLVRYLIYPVFASITVHRGLFHSLPAALLLALCVYSLTLYGLQWSLQLAWLSACFVCAGYLVHLLLDEFYSVDFMGRNLKSSFGSALTLFSFSSWPAYTAMYMAVGLGFYVLPLPHHILRFWTL